MKIFKKNLKGGNSHKAVRTASLFVLNLVFVLVLYGVVSAGTPLQVNQPAQ